MINPYLLLPLKLCVGSQWSITIRWLLAAGVGLRGNPQGRAMPVASPMLLIHSRKCVLYCTWLSLQSIKRKQSKLPMGGV